MAKGMVDMREEIAEGGENAKDAETIANGEENDGNAKDSSSRWPGE